MANSSPIVGKVVSLQGQAIVRSADGSQHQLKLGDVIYENDVITTAPNSRVELSFNEGRTYLVRENETVSLDASVFAPSQSDIANAALPATNTEAGTIANAVIGGDSLDRLLEETAAGLTGGTSSGDGNSFVQLDRIAETVTPQTFLGGTGRGTFDVNVDGAPNNNTIQTPTVVSVSSPTANESGNLDFTVTLSGASNTATTLNLSPNSGTGTLGVDTRTALVSVDGGFTFVPLTATVNVPAGVTSVIVRIPTVDDGVIEGAETVSLSASTSTNGAPIVGTGTINDGAVPSLSISGPPDVNEAAGTVTYTVTLSAPSVAPISVNYNTVNGTALAGSDYVQTNGTVNFAPGETTKTFTVAITNDTIFEGAENYRVNLSGATNATISTASTLTTIHDDGTGVGGTDNDKPSLSINDITVNETAGTATFTVVLSASSAVPVTVSYNTSDGTATAGNDYSITNGNLTFAPGVTSQTVTVAITNDSVFEGNETFNVNLATPTNATIADNQGVGTIVDGSIPSLSVSNTTVAESAGFAVFTVSLSNTSTQATTVNLALGGGNATGSGTDYGSATPSNLQVSTDGGLTWNNATTATIAAGSTSVLVRTPITDDSINEPAETFNLTATTTAGTTSNPSAVGIATITDNDGAPTLAINDITVNEATGTATFTVTLSAASGQAVSVGYNTSNGTATAGSDYTATAGTLTFAPGVTSQTVTVAITNDTVFEGSETFNVNLVTPTNATIADNLGIGTIRDDGTGTGGNDDDTPRVASVSSPSIGEGGNLDFTVTLTNSSTTPTTLNLTPANGSGTIGTDTGAGQVSFDGGTTFVAITPTVSVPAGVTSILVRYPTINDGVPEGSETITLGAATPANAGVITGTGTILDGAIPSLSITGAPNVNEAAGTVTYTVSLSSASPATVSVNYNTVNGTATAGSDYTAGSGSLTFAPGETTKTITVAITNDSVFEGAETYQVQLSGAINAGISTASVTTTIRDDGTGTG